MLPIPSFLAPTHVFASALNTLLRREPWALEKLARHAGKTVRFAVGPWVAGLTLLSDGGVQPSDPAVVPDVTLTIPSANLGQLPQALRSADPSEIAGLMHVQGDAGLAAVVSELARDLRWDVEDDLARVVGDVAAVRLLGGARKLLDGTRLAGRRLAGNMGEYLSEESRVLVSRPPFIEWQAGVQAALRRLDALERSVAGLEHSAARQGRNHRAC